MYSERSLIDILKEYNSISSGWGFQPDVVKNTFKILERSLLSRGLKGNAYGDYTYKELIQSWRFAKLVDDLKFGL